jgi:hypothetical protein
MGASAPAKGDVRPDRAQSAHRLQRAEGMPNARGRVSRPVVVSGYPLTAIRSATASPRTEYIARPESACPVTGSSTPYLGPSVRNGSCRYGPAGTHWKYPGNCAGTGRRAVPRSVLVSTVLPEGRKTLHPHPTRIRSVDTETHTFGCKGVDQYQVRNTVLDPEQPKARESTRKNQQEEKERRV